jgi:hypothetical protein
MHRHRLSKIFVGIFIVMTLQGGAGEAQATSIVITEGGTYTGNWESQDLTVPVVDIQTSEPVLIQNAVLRGKGTLINIRYAQADVTIKHCSGYGINPNIRGRVMGKFIDSEWTNNLVVENNFIEGTSGIYVQDFYGDGSTNQTIKIQYNQFRNIDGRHSDGVGGYLSSPEGGSAVQFNQVRHVANIEIAWNEIINQPWKSRTEDVMNFFLSSGTASSRLLVHDNFIDGSYPADPVTDDFTGGGIITDGPAQVADNATAYLYVYNNQVIRTTNYGIGISAGHHNEFANNRVIASGHLSDGRWVNAQNIGAYIYNIYNAPAAAFTYNSMHDNEIGWQARNSFGKIARNDLWLPGCETGECENNTPLPAPITHDTEAAEYTLWQNKLKANGIRIGEQNVNPAGIQ